MCRLVKFYEGGLLYDVAMSLSFSELMMLTQEANRINRETEREVDARMRKK